MPERVDDATEAPAVLIPNRGECLRASGNRTTHHDLGIIYHQQDSSGRALEIAWAESPPGSVRAGDPEAGLAADRKLRHNLVAVADEVYHSGPECVTVEFHGVTSPIDPEFGLYTGHVQNLTSDARVR